MVSHSRLSRTLVQSVFIMLQFNYEYYCSIAKTVCRDSIVFVLHLQSVTTAEPVLRVSRGPFERNDVPLHKGMQTVMHTRVIKLLRQSSANV